MTGKYAKEPLSLIICCRVAFICLPFFCVGLRRKPSIFVILVFLPSHMRSVCTPGVAHTKFLTKFLPLQPILSCRLRTCRTTTNPTADHAVLHYLRQMTGGLIPSPSVPLVYPRAARPDADCHQPASSLSRRPLTYTYHLQKRGKITSAANKMLTKPVEPHRHKQSFASLTASHPGRSPQATQVAQHTHPQRRSSRQHIDRNHTLPCQARPTL